MKAIKMTLVGTLAYVAVTVLASGSAQASERSYEEADILCSKFREMAEYIMHKRQYRASLHQLLREFHKIPTAQTMVYEAYDWHYSTHADVKRMIVKDFGEKHYNSCMQAVAGR